MTYYRARIRKRRVAGLLAVIAAVAATLSNQLPGPSTASSAPTTTASAVPDDVTVVQESPDAGGLDPDLLAAFQRAAADASSAGVELQINSGWRSPEHQAELLREAIAKYGSEQEAARWVARPETSVHVSGDAIDVGPTEAAAWLHERGATYGLCRIYGNEPWHFELRPEAPDQGCPALYPDPTYDPRMNP